MKLTPEISQATQCAVGVCLGVDKTPVWRGLSQVEGTGSA
jgi:hypothetical protein